jgi:hypothetical protein
MNLKYKFRSIAKEVKGLFQAFHSQRINRIAVIAVVIFLLGLFFTFLTYNPALSPFVYPLF